MILFPAEDDEVAVVVVVVVALFLTLLEVVVAVMEEGTTTAAAVVFVRVDDADDNDPAELLPVRSMPAPRMLLLFALLPKFNSSKMLQLFGIPERKFPKSEEVCGEAEYCEVLLLLLLLLLL